MPASDLHTKCHRPPDRSSDLLGDTGLEVFMGKLPRTIYCQPLRLRQVERVIAGLEFDERALTATLESSHGLHSEGVRFVEGNAVTQPAKEWADLARFEVLKVGLIVRPLLRDPRSNTERVLSVDDWDEYHTSNVEGFIVNHASVGGANNSRVPFHLGHGEVGIRPSEAQMRQSFVYSATGCAIEGHVVSPNAQVKPNCSA